MADNYSLATQTAVNIASDEIVTGGVAVQHPYVKMEFGVPDSATPVSSSNPLPVAIISGDVEVSQADKSTFTPGTSNVVPVAGLYQSSLDTLTSGQAATPAIDVNRRSIMTLGTLLAGEDLTNNKLVTEQRYTYASINTAATTLVKTGAGYVDHINILGGTAGAITVYDNTVGSGAAIWPTFTPGNVTVPVSIPVHCVFSTGLTIVTGAATVIQVAYR